jgi:hypothetical protein
MTTLRQLRERAEAARMTMKGATGLFRRDGQPRYSPAEHTGRRSRRLTDSLKTA